MAEDQKTKLVTQQMNMFKGVIEKPRTSEDVFDLPDLAVSFNLFTHGNAKRMVLDHNENEQSLVSPFKDDDVTVSYTGNVILGRAHERVFTELVSLYQESAMPIHEYMEIPYSSLSKLCGLLHGTGNLKETKRRVFDLRSTVLTISDNKLIDELILNWDILMKSSPTEEFKLYLDQRYSSEIGHLKKIRKDGKKGFITLNLIDSLAGEDSEQEMRNKIDVDSVKGSIGVRLNPLLTLFYSNNRNIFVSKAFEDFVDGVFTVRILFLLKSRSLFYDRYLSGNFLAWFMKPGWTGFSTKQTRYKTITKILDSFIEIESIGQIADGIRFIKTKRMEPPYGKPPKEGAVKHKASKVQVYKIINVERIYPGAESILVQNGIPRNSPLYRLLGIYQATQTKWGLRKWDESHIIDEGHDCLSDSYRLIIPMNEIYERLKCHKKITWEDDIEKIKTSMAILEMTEQLKRLGIIEAYKYDLEVGISNVVFYTHIKNSTDNRDQPILLGQSKSEDMYAYQ